MYRLLGIPGRKLGVIFALESLLSSLTIALPCVFVPWAIINVANLVPELELNLLLPWQGALVVFVCILCYHLIVSLIPLCRLLRLSPTQLASKYDM